MNFGVVDIGSNAIRVQLNNEFDVLYFQRFALRLGEDVFSTQNVSNEKTHQLKEILFVCQELFVKYNVVKHRIVATSAMRDANNAKGIISEIQNELGLNIEVISGVEEAELMALLFQTFFKNKNGVHIDVGGGSTEVNIFVENNLEFASSLNIGAVRLMSGDDHNLDLNQISNYKCETAILTGGNAIAFNSILEVKNGDYYSINDFKNRYDFVKKEGEGLLKKYNMTNERLQVLPFALYIYRSILECLGVEYICAPNLGLKDAVIKKLVIDEK